jgi:hypothetical protein
LFRDTMGLWPRTGVPRERRDRRISARPLRYEQLDSRALLAADVIINEIMYNPSSFDDRDEWIELYNRDFVPVDLTGWRFTRGMDFLFPATTLPVGGYLVVAADVAHFTSTHPGVTNVVGGWTGRLSNSSETLEISDATYDPASTVDYADEGDWAARRLVNNSWTWQADHDGVGRSLELRNQALTNDAGANWGPSTGNGGTPGAVNSINSTNIAPLIQDVIHGPVVPRSNETVTVTATIRDEQTSGITAQVFYRAGGTGAFQSVPMFDDGNHGDGMDEDGVYAGTIPAQANDAIIEFYVRASDAGNNARTWPAPTDTSGTQGANAMYQVTNTVESTTMPLFRLIMTPAEVSRFNGSNGDQYSHVTFVSQIGTEVDVQYLSGVRHRGNSSRGFNPPPMRMDFTHDDLWNGVRALNLNTVNAFNQVIGMEMFELGGVGAENVFGAQVRRNGVNPLGSRPWTAYAALEVFNEDWAENHFPGDGDGNLYRGVGARLEYTGGGSSGYGKRTNENENDWTDLADLTRILDPNQTPNPTTFEQQVGSVLNVHQWLRHLAIHQMLVNEENGLINGAGDDWELGRGVIDPRFHLVPHDLDELLDQGSQGQAGTPNRTIIGEMDNNPQLSRLVRHPSFLPLFWGHMRDLAEGLFSAAQFNPLIDQVLGGWTPQNTIDAMKNFLSQRVSYVLSQIPPGTPMLTPALRDVRITEIMYDAADGGRFEYIEVQNTGSQTLDLTGAHLDGGIGYTFGSVSLGPGEYAVVVDDMVSFRSRYGATPRVLGEYTGTLDNLGEPIQLVAGEPLFQNVLDFAYQSTWYPTTAGDGYSLVIVNPTADPETWGTSGSWRPSNFENGSPGSDDSGIPAGSVVINEVLSHTDLANGDRIELFNTTDVTIDLSGFYLSDDPGTRNKYRIPNGTSILPGDYLVFNQATHFGPAVNPTGFALSELGDDIYLTAPNGVSTSDSVDFGASEREISFGRHVTSDGAKDITALVTNTFGAANAAPMLGPVVINEVMYNPAGNLPTDVEYIELVNISAGPVSLFDPARPANTWQISSGIDYAFPAGITLAPGEFIVVVPFDPNGDPGLAADFRTARGMPSGVTLVGPFTGALNNAGEGIKLSKPDEPEPDLTVPYILVDRVDYDDESPWPAEPDGGGPSLGRESPVAYGNDVASWDSTTPGGTAGRTNTFLDRTPPTSPSGLSFQAVAATQVDLSWSAASDPESGVMQYNIYRNGLLIGTTAATSFSDPSAAAHVALSYQVSAVNPSALEGPLSTPLLALYAGIDGVWTIGDNQIAVTFSDPLTAASAANLANFNLAGATISGAVLRPDQHTVVLSTSGPLVAGTGYSLTTTGLATTNGRPLPATSAAFSFGTPKTGLSSRVINPAAPPASISDADLALRSPSGGPGLNGEGLMVGTVNFSAGGAGGHFAADAGFPAGTTAASPLVLRATGIITVSTAGTWTFGATAPSNASGWRLRIDGSDVLQSAPGIVIDDLFGTVNLAAGDHFVDLVYYTTAGSGGIELYAALGSFNSFAQTSTWDLVGDTASGGLPARSQPSPPIAIVWTRKTPFGGLAGEFAQNVAASIANGSLLYAATLPAGQSLSVAATPTLAGASATITVRRGGNIVASGASPSVGAPAIVDTGPLGATGDYTIELTSAAATGFDVRAALNGALELESITGASNNSTANAQNLNTAAVDLGGGASHAAVSGSIVFSSGYNTTVLADAPAVYYRLRETSNNTARNDGSAGATANGAYFAFGAGELGQAGIVPNVPGSAPFFDGIDNRIDVPGHPQVNTGGPYDRRTVEVWFQAEAVENRQLIFKEGNFERGLNIYLEGGQIYVGVYDRSATTGWGELFLNAPVTAGTVNHVAAILDQPAGTFTGYLNGVAFGQATGAGRLSAHTAAKIAGNSTTAGTRYHTGPVTTQGQYFRGKLSELAIYNTALPAARVAAHYANGAESAHDLYRIDIAAGQSISAVVDGDGGGTWQLELLDSAAAVVATGTSGATNFDVGLHNQSVPAGTYYLRVASTTSGNYSLVATRGADFDREPNGSIATDQDIDPSKRAIGYLTAADAGDYYQVTLAAGQTVRIATATPLAGVGMTPISSLDPRLVLFNPGGTSVASDDSSGDDGRNARLDFTPTQTGLYTVQVVSQAGQGEYVLSIGPSSSQASLVDIVVSGSQWSAGFVAALEAQSLGSGGYSILHNGGSPVLTWTNLDRVTLVFDRPVAATAGDLTLRGVNQATYASTFVGATGNSATWNFASGIADDRLTIDLSTAIDSLLGNGGATYAFAALRGDVNRDGVVAVADRTATLRRAFTLPGLGNYDVYHDVNGDGRINVLDAVRVRDRVGGSLPAPSPAASAAVVAQMSERRAANLRGVVRRALSAREVDRVFTVQEPEAPALSAGSVRSLLRRVE